MLLQTKKCNAHQNIMRQEHACTKQLHPFTGKNLTGNEKNTRPEMKKSSFRVCHFGHISEGIFCLDIFCNCSSPIRESSKIWARSNRKKNSFQGPFTRPLFAMRFCICVFAFAFLHLRLHICVFTFAFLQSVRKELLSIIK